MGLNPNTKLGPYEILAPLGAGGMGEVYLAKDTKLDRQVAIKVLPHGVASNPERRQRFEREAKTVAALNHPNIVTIFGIEDSGGQYYLAMELVEGETLDRMIAPGGMPLAKIFDIAIPLADALAAAHDKGIVHRDLKPGNVMVTKDGRVKVLDFGLAKLTPEEPGGSSPRDATVSAPLTGHGAILGTVPYMSPEQLRSERVDHRTDLFSLGIMLYEMGTGQRPFKGAKSADVMSSILRDAPRPLHELNGALPRPLGKLISMCLEKDPENRLQSAKDLRNELRSLRKEVDSDSYDPTPRPVSAATASPLPSIPPSPASVTTIGSALSAPTRRGEFWIGVVVVIVAIATGLWWMGRDRTGPEKTPALTGNVAVTSAVPAKPEQVNSLAVLPFVNMSSEKEQEYFSDGLTEELLNALAKIPDLKVSGRTSSFSFKGKNENLRTIGEKLGVANILEGSVRKSGDKVRITAQLVKAADGFHLWSETYDRTLDDIFAVQDDIARSVTQALRVTLLGQGRATLRPDPSTYDMILQARFELQYPKTENMRRAREILQRALEASPESASVWAELGLVHQRELELANSLDERRQALEQKKQALSRALELDPDLAVANSRMAGVYRDSWNFAEAARSTERALAAEPKNSIVTGNAAILYRVLGRMDEAIALEEQGVDRDPLDVRGRANLAADYLAAGRLDDSERTARRVLAMHSDDIVANSALGTILLLRGDVPAARPYFEKLVTAAGWGERGRLFYEALMAHAAGNEEPSAKAAREYESNYGAEDSTGCATIRAWRGEKDLAFGWLEKSLAAHDPALAQIKAETMMVSLHADPRWNELLKKIGLPTD